MIAAALRGDRSAWTWMVRRFSPLLLAQAHYRMGPVLRRYVDPEDVVEDVWALCLDRISDVHPRGRATPVVVRYLTTTLLHRVNQLARQALRHRRFETPDRDPAAEWIWSGRSPATQAADRDEIRAILRILETMDPRDREVLVLRVIEQRPVEEVADLLRVTANVVHVRKHRAMERLRQRLPADLLAELEPER